MLLDTSVAVALVVASHEAHELALDACEGLELGLSGHAWFETFSVLTRLPPPARRDVHQVGTLLSHNFPASRFLSADATAVLCDRLPELGIAGGSVYDALVGHCATSAGLQLMSLDRRAVGTYRAVGAHAEILG